MLLNVDITFAAASFVLYDISKHLDVQNKLKKEIDSVFSSQDPVKLDVIQGQLPYLNMVILESARMHPTIGVMLPEVTVKDVTDMAGYQVPKGVNVIYLLLLTKLNLLANSKLYIFCIHETP